MINLTNKISEIPLKGCRSEPFSSYFKSLGILRILSEQVDSEIKGFWKDNIFHIVSPLSPDEIVDFFLKKYEPTPIVSPWSKSSGFYEEDIDDNFNFELKGSRKSLGIKMILSSSDIRFSSYINIIKKTFHWLRELGLTKKNMDEQKKQIILYCRNELPDTSLGWIDSSWAIGKDGEARPAAILINGGSDGAHNIAGSYMQSLYFALISNQDKDMSYKFICNALFDSFAKDLPNDVIVGFLCPGRAGGCNMGTDFEVEDFTINPWEIILAIEGLMLWSSTAVKRFDAKSDKLFATPFLVKPKSIGYTSASSSEENPQKTRAEVWLPLWPRPLSQQELQTFIKEGRAEIGNKKANNALEFAGAVSSLGVDRGVDSFNRYTLIKRRGKDNHVALPSGSVNVKYRSESDLVRTLDGIQNQINFAFFKVKGSGQDIPAVYQNAKRVFEESIFQYTLKGGKTKAKKVLESLGNIEKLLIRNYDDEENNRPRLLRDLDPRWIQAAHDDSIEVRISSAFASIRGDDKSGIGEIRSSLCPMPSRSGGNISPVVFKGGSIYAKMSAVLQRRFMDAEKSGLETLPLKSLIYLHLDDITAFINGEFDSRLLENLIYCFTLINWKRYRDVYGSSFPFGFKSEVQRPVYRDYALLKMLFLPFSIKEESGKEVKIKPESSIIPLLRAGRIKDACAIAKRRLFVSQLNPVKCDFTDHDRGPQTAAALLLPVDNYTVLSKLKPLIIK